MTGVHLDRRRLLGLVAVVAILVGIVAGISRSPAAATQRPGPYGSAIGADGLANTQVGGDASGSANELVAYRFRAQETGAVATVRLYLVDGSGYAGGTGGTLSLSIQTDDDSVNHGPSGVVLAKSLVITPGNPVSIGYLPQIAFPTPAHLVAGRLYDLVIENLDPSPTLNFVSVNAIWTMQLTQPRQPAVADLDWAELINDGSGWVVRPSYAPILDLGYADGLHQGMGYIEVWVESAEAVSGGASVRETFTPTAARSISGVAIRLSRSAGTSPLTVTLEPSAGGAILGTGSIAAASFGGNPGWASVAFGKAISLNPGTSYKLQLSTAADTSYSAVAIERGDNYQFDPLTYFGDGHAEFSKDGSTWSGFNQPGGSSDNLNSDLQFYFN